MKQFAIGFVVLALCQTPAAKAATGYTSPQVFPSPNATGDGGWSEAYHKAEELISKLSLEQKVSLVTGTIFGGSGCVGNINPIDSVGFKGLCLQDGPLSVRTADLASTFPAGVTVAASWDRELMYARGKALGAEFRGKGAHLINCPVAGPLGRHPMGGRNWEGFSPDPYLTGVAMNSTIRGTQDMGVQACAKHIIGNEQETQRTNSFSPNGTEIAAISSNIDDRTMHELYLWPFADAVKSGVASVISWNGLLKSELGFQGYVISDWFSMHSGAPSALAGLDMNMPGVIKIEDMLSGNSYWGKNLTRAVGNHSVPESRLNDMTRRILTPYFYLGQDKDYPSVDPSSFHVLIKSYGLEPSQFGLPRAPPAMDVRGNHKALIRQLGAAGIVLLKNTNSALPLKKPQNIVIFGYDAADVADGVNYQGNIIDALGPSTPHTGFTMGTLSVGGSSGSARNPYVVSPLQAIRDRSDARLQYILNNEFIIESGIATLYPDPDVCLVFLKTWSEEGRDRLSFENDYNSTQLVEKVASSCPNTVVITHSSGVNTLPWAHNTNVTAILAAHYPGQESGNSIVDVLFGDVNPSGRLPYTIPVHESDYDFPIVNITGPAAYDTAAWQSDFTEGLMIDYRHFDAMNIKPLYEFGFGLSYTTFDFEGELEAKSVKSILSQFPNSTTRIAPGGNPDLYTELFTATTTVRNTGKVDGDSVVQLYVSFEAARVPEGTPKKVLRGFEKVHLKAGEEAQVQFQLTRRDLSFWNTTAQNWQIPAGNAHVMLGFSSRDIRQKTDIKLL
ncbi:beta-glucosidase [Aspergillus pseudocaelatus]|uniref:Probable beta-glucosidase G n=1 Tax=Aspergillus pseudocaelatus TaxID=1825620 RepID=A0ABQ6WZX1_9EURO|nr:beta-glucosidase [Aspergillus pseudocaelatus]